MRNEVADWTVLQVLDWTRQRFADEGIDAPRLDAELLLAHTLQLPRIQLYARYDQPLSQDERGRFRDVVKRRLSREPVAYIVGRKEFWSLDLSLTAEVLIPRPDTETLVERALERLPKDATGELIDVGTGSGAVALALAKERPHTRALGVDVSTSAVDVAIGNAERLGISNARFVRGDLLEGAPSDLELVVANLPYIPSAEVPRLMPEVSQHEPSLALDGGPDGLDLYRRLAPSAIQHLAPGRWALFECGHDQTDALATLLTDAGFEGVQTTKDLGGTPRIVEARRPEGP